MAGTKAAFFKRLRIVFHLTTFLAGSRMRGLDRKAGTGRRPPFHSSAVNSGLSGIQRRILADAENAVK
jgi:hypothetical protein